MSTITRPQTTDLDLLRHDLLIAGEWVARVARGTREDDYLELKYVCVGGLGAPLT